MNSFSVDVLVIKEKIKMNRKSAFKTVVDKDVNYNFVI